jgi:hypothetical protein
MTTTLSYAGVTVTPRLVLGWAQSRGSLNLEHPLIGGGRDITHTPPTLRTGTVEYLFITEVEALDAEAMHRTAPYIDLASDDRVIANMRYVLPEGGQLAVTLDDATRDVWTLSVDYREVTP